MEVGKMIREYNDKGNYRSIVKDSPEGLRLIQAAERNPDMWGWMTAKANDADIENSDVISAVNSIQNEASKYDKSVKEQRLRQIKIRAEDNKPTRMAGDKVDVVERLLADYERELDIESDAIQYASNRRPDLDLLRAEGQSYGDIEEQLLKLGQLRGNVPAPLVDKLADGNELRTHTRYGTNDVTGEREVRPFIDTETGEALVTEFGMLDDLLPMTHNRNNPNATPTASEYVGLNAAKLMDGESTTFNTGPHQYADVINDGRNVDLMMVGRGGNYDDTINIPRFTNIIKNSDFNLEGEINKLRKGGLTIEQAVSRLANLGEIKPVNPSSYGKLAKSDMRNVSNNPAAVYDELLVSGYDRGMYNQAAAIKMGRQPYGRPHPLAKEFATDKLAVAPETLHQVDLAGLRGAIDSGEVKSKIFTNKNRGVDGRGHIRDKVQEIIPQKGNPYVQDLSISHPFTQQILKNLPYV